MTRRPALWKLLLVLTSSFSSSFISSIPHLACSCKTQNTCRIVIFFLIYLLYSTCMLKFSENACVKNVTLFHPRLYAHEEWVLIFSVQLYLGLFRRPAISQHPYMPSCHNEYINKFKKWMLEKKD